MKYRKKLYTEISKRHQRLFRLMDDNSIMVLRASNAKTYSGDVEYPYRQDSNFYYLTGIEEDQALVFFLKRNGVAKALLFCQQRDKAREAWTTRRLGVEDAKKHCVADRIEVASRFLERFRSAVEDCGRLYCDTDDMPFFTELVGACAQARRANHRALFPDSFSDVRTVLGKLRSAKSALELKFMCEAIRISVDAHLGIWHKCLPGVSERELDALLTATFVQNKARAAYPHIVGGGKNACTLHYTRNSSRLSGDTLLLVDAGAEFNFYAADITRTVPVNGKFNAAQREAYEIVLIAQAKAIGAIYPGSCLQDMHGIAVTALTEGLTKIGVLTGKVSKLVRSRAYLPYYMHSTGHWLGMDVHDINCDSRVSSADVPFTKNMVMTVEPGLYFQDGKNIPPELRHTGIRVEDDVLVTNDGHKVLTSELPKEVQKIEDTMSLLRQG